MKGGAVEGKEQLGCHRAGGQGSGHAWVRPPLFARQVAHVCGPKARAAQLLPSCRCAGSQAGGAMGPENGRRAGGEGAVPDMDTKKAKTDVE